jgi:hypothetical protein
LIFCAFLFVTSLFAAEHDIDRGRGDKADDDVEEGHGQEGVEGAEVVPADALADPGAVVVEALDADVAVRAVLRPSALQQVACVAESVLVLHLGRRRPARSRYSRLGEANLQVGEDEAEVGEGSTPLPEGGELEKVVELDEEQETAAEGPGGQEERIWLEAGLQCGPSVHFGSPSGPGQTFTRLP